MSVPTIADPAVANRPAPRRRPRARLRAVPDTNPALAATPAAAPTAVPAPRPGISHTGVPDSGATAPLTVTISVDGGAPETRDRLAAALRDLVAAAGRDLVPPSGEPASGAAGVVHIDPEPRAAFRDGRLLDLSRLEYDLLLFFARHPRQVFSRGQLLAEVWGHVHTGARTVDVHVSRLRQKLGEPELIATVYGVGYRLADAAPVRVAPPRAGGVSWTA